jgi:hypothetical protein
VGQAAEEAERAEAIRRSQLEAAAERKAVAEAALAAKEAEVARLERQQQQQQQQQEQQEQQERERLQRVAQVEAARKALEREVRRYSIAGHEQARDGQLGRGGV